MLTVLLVTRDGGRTLPEVLAAHRRLVAPPGGWRLVVVDNGSTDETRARLAEHAAHLPLVLRHEPVRGQNRARRAGEDAVEGDLLVLTDDDAVPAPGWLLALRAAADAHPAHDVIVGTVRPRFERPPAPWLLEVVRPGPVWAQVERERAEEVDPTEGLGPNVAIRTRALGPRPWFDVALGPDGTATYPMGAETSLLVALRGRGARAWYAKDAVVEHLVPAAHVEPAWVVARAFRYGRGRARMRTARASRSRWRWRGVPWRTWADLAGRRGALWRAGADPRRRFKALWRLALLAGEAYEARAAAGARDPWGPVARWLPRPLRGLAAGEPIDLSALGA
ncbi:MAG: glycosyltransferase [Planctomycetes bacterium]|nr:glycosyltransferase [Planctomycetota bacterium]